MAKKSAGRIQPVKMEASFKAQADPEDIDDDVSDHGSESVE